MTNLKATQVLPTSVTLTWSRPTAGTAPIHYEVRSRLKGTANWFITARTMQLTATINALTPKTAYEIEVLAFNN